jgi:hypothetical protein
MRLYRTASRSLNPRLFIIAFLLACCIPPAASAEKSELEARALELYGQGRYGEALPLLEELDGEGLADGPLLYRLYYCRNHLKAPGARQTQERALVQLESELSEATDLETPFYLANVYRNVGRLTDMRRVASEATGRVESGDLPRPESAVGMFQLGKLYADQDDEESATEWYSGAIDGLVMDDRTQMPAYAAWAARYLADRAEARGDHEAAAEYHSLLSSDGSASGRDLEKAAVGAVRAGAYGRAAAAWRSAAALSPAQADRSRYCARLAEAAGQIGGLPELSPDGRPWKELSQEDLGAILSEKAGIIRNAFTEAHRIDMLMRELTATATESFGSSGAVRKMQRSFEKVWSEMIPDHQLTVDGAREYFVAASLEFAIRRYGLRETAFFGGYASLIFGNEEWDIAKRLDVNAAREDAEERKAQFGEQSEELIEAAGTILGEGQEHTKLKKTLQKLAKRIS